MKFFQPKLLVVLSFVLLVSALAAKDDCTDFKVITIDQDHSKLMSNDPNHELSQIAAFIETGSDDKLIRYRPPEFLSGLNKATVSVKPWNNGGISGIRIYFEVQDPHHRIQPQYQIRLEICQKGAKEYREPVGID